MKKIESASWIALIIIIIMMIIYLGFLIYQAPKEKEMQCEEIGVQYDSVNNLCYREVDGIYYEVRTVEINGSIMELRR